MLNSQQLDGENSQKLPQKWCLKHVKTPFKTMVSCRFVLKISHWSVHWYTFEGTKTLRLYVEGKLKGMVYMLLCNQSSKSIFVSATSQRWPKIQNTCASAKIGLSRPLNWCSKFIPLKSLRRTTLAEPRVGPNCLTVTCIFFSDSRDSSTCGRRSMIPYIICAKHHYKLL